MIRTKEITIEDGDDAGKVFLVNQMSLIQGDKWANRVALALCKSGVDLGAFTGGDGFKGMLDMVNITNAALKALGGVEDEVAQGLLDELLQTIKVRLPDGSTRSVILETDITSIATLWKLRIESIKVNLDFLMSGVTQ